MDAHAGTDRLPNGTETLTYTVTAIGDDAFAGKSLSSIDLPDTIEVIGERAFKGCSNLSTMN